MSQGRLLGGRYQVGELLGYGGMAEVHHGRDLRLGRDVAIKTLRNDLARDAMFQLRFRREAQNAAALNHPAIVAVYDTGEERGQHGEALPYIIMEYVNGRTLKEVLSAEGRLMPRRAMELTADICSALEFSHRHGIIHRDIKPGNVMLTQAGQVKVMDFGIARALASGATTMTQTSAVIGTAQYLSPEQARGEAVDARSDVYATGCVIFELLCGHPPFVGDNPVSVAYQHVREDPRPPSTSNRDVTPDVDAVVLKALAKNPLNRYQSAGEMRGDLMRAVAGRPVTAPPVLTEDEMTAMIEPQTSPRSTRTTRSTPSSNRDITRAAQQRHRGSIAVAVALSFLGVIAVVVLAAGLLLQTKDKVEVPNIIGLTEQQASQKLSEKGLQGIQSKNPKKSDCIVGQITDQDPTEGRKIDKNEKISYDLCLGPGKTKVPSLAGLNRKDAESSLKEANLVSQFVEVDSDKEKGDVVDSSPTSGTELAPGEVVTVKISKGNLRVLPDLTGLSKTSAEQKLRSNGFVDIDFVDRETTNPNQVDKVLGQSPDSGKAISPTKTIIVYIGKSEKVPSPSPSLVPSSSSHSPSS